MKHEPDRRSSHSIAMHEHNHRWNRHLLFSWLVAAAPAFAAPAHAEDEYQCYVSAEHPYWTLTEAMLDFGPGLVWQQDDKRIELSTGGIGTGIVARMATEENGDVHTYLYVRGVLIFDMVPYEPGCSKNRTWVDRDCKRILISQGDAGSDHVTYYFIDRGGPVASCRFAGSFQEGSMQYLKCNSGRNIKLEVGGSLIATVDGMEMRDLRGDLPCRSHFGDPAATFGD